MTPTSLSVVIVGGGDEPVGSGNSVLELPAQGADGRSSTARATAAVEAIAATRGERLTSIGVTWSDDADAEASLLMSSLTESGFDNVVPVRLPEATEALARGMAEVIDCRTTAVCVIEPDTAIALIVHADDGAVQTAVNHGIDSDESLIGWLSTVFARADWQPEALVLVGSAGGFDSVHPRLEEALSVPVFAPAEAPLALARGAALASTHNAGLPLDSAPLFSSAGSGRHAAAVPRISPSRVFAGLLVAGVVSFVVSGSVALAVQLSPAGPGEPGPAATAERIVNEAPVVRPSASVALPPPPPAAPVVPDLVEAVAPVVETVVESAPPPALEPVMDTAPAGGPYVLEEPAAAPPPPVVAPPTEAGPPPVVGPVYDQPKKPLLQRIRDRLRIGGDEQAPPPIIMNPPMG
ncbi:hypothetical protein L2K20_19820 [Mycobacterium sp. MBM]|nr:hypothetical protein [Mycobacterium sp. MBM]